MVKDLEEEEPETIDSVEKSDLGERNHKKSRQPDLEGRVVPQSAEPDRLCNAVS